MSILLMGLRGSGKSTIGPLLAQRLHKPFIDLDNRTAAYLGHDTVAAAWRQHGEPAFRTAEVECLRAALAEGDSVIALGGGTPTAPGAEELLSGPGLFLAYLRADGDTLRTRLAATDTTTRPSLTGASMLDEIEQIHAKRDPIYRRLADAVIEVAGHPAEAVVDAIARLQAPTASADQTGASPGDQS